MTESWETKAGGNLGSPSQRDNLFDYLKKKKKEEEGLGLGPPISTLKSGQSSVLKLREAYSPPTAPKEAQRGGSL